MKKLVKHGNSYALIIDKPILELLHITPDTPLELFTDGNRLVVQPQQDAARVPRVQTVHQDLMERYGDTFRKLAE
jgi:antitoxin component of MazEF toxin-antitoxin module